MFTSEPFLSIITHQAGVVLIHRALGCRRDGGGVWGGEREGWEEGRVGVPGLNILQRARQSASRGANERDELARTILSLFFPRSLLGEQPLVCRDRPCGGSGF